MFHAQLTCMHHVKEQEKGKMCADQAQERFGEKKIVEKILSFSFENAWTAVKQLNAFQLVHLIFYSIF